MPGLRVAQRRYAFMSTQTPFLRLGLDFNFIFCKWVEPWPWAVWTLSRLKVPQHCDPVTTKPRLLAPRALRGLFEGAH